MPANDNAAREAGDRPDTKSLGDADTVESEALLPCSNSNGRPASNSEPEVETASFLEFECAGKSETESLTRETCNADDRTKTQNEKAEFEEELCCKEKEESLCGPTDIEVFVNGNLGDIPKRESEAYFKIEEFEKDSWIPDGGWGWAVVLGGVIVHIFVGGLMKASGVMYMVLHDKFEESAVATAWVFSLFTTFLLMMGPVASALCHRFSCRAVVFWGSILCFIGILLSAYAPNITYLYFSYAVIGGFGRCLTYTPSLILVTNYFEKRRGLAVGTVTAGVGLGLFSFPPLIEYLFSNYGYQGAMTLLAAISLHSFICAVLFRPLDHHKKISKTIQTNKLIKMAQNGSNSAREMVRCLTATSLKQMDKLKEDTWHGSNIFSSTTEFTYVVPEPRRKSVFIEKIDRVKGIFKGNTSSEKSPPFLELSLLKDFPFLTLCLAILFFTMSMMSTFVFLPPLARSRGVTQMQSAYLISVIGLCDSIARFSSGFILDMKRVKPYRVLVYNAMMFGVGIVSIIMPSVSGFTGFVVISACFGVLEGTYVAQKSVVVVDVLGIEKMTSSFGLLLGFQGIGSLVGPTISGLFRDVYGSYDMAFYFGGTGMIFGGIVLLCGNVYKILRDRKTNRANITVGEGHDS